MGGIDQGRKLAAVYIKPFTVMADYCPGNVSTTSTEDNMYDCNTLSFREARET